MDLLSLGWNDRLESLFERFLESGLAPSRVLRVDRGAVLVACEGDLSHATLAGSLDSGSEPAPAAVGDWVAVDSSDGSHIIHSILPRAGVLSRRRPGAAERAQVVAGNVDLVLLTEALDRGLSPGRIERGVALAYDGGATPAVVLTKSDSCSDLEAQVARAEDAAPFCAVVAVSSLTGDGLQSCADLLTTGRTAVLLGPSGAGKSTLANCLLGESRLAAAAVRGSDHKGRHTTTRRELVVLPGGGCLIDTPGIRELGLWLDPEALDHAFSDIEAYARGCRFTNCQHITEPDCGVLAAVAAGELDSARLASYLKLSKEAEAMELRRDASRRPELRAHERRFAKMVRAHIKQKNE